jgi:tRNA (cytidine/uridine-2'-O-)-methyltransferase
MHSPDTPPARLRLALYQPDIPQNAGTMLRACACLGVGAAIIEPAGFPVSDRHFRRSGMDYLDALEIDRHESFAAFEAWRAARRQAAGGHRLILLTTQGAVDYAQFAFAPDDIIMTGRETAGVPEYVHAAADARLAIPMRPGMRSLNVAVAAAMVLGEALRQLRAAADRDTGA